MKARINNYIHNLSIDKKMEKYHLIFKNAIQLIKDKKIDDVLIIYNNANDIDCLAIIDELLLLKKSVSTLFFYKKTFKWKIDFRKITKISDLDSFFNIKYTLNKTSEIIDISKIKNLLICIDNYNFETKSTKINYDQIYKIITKVNFINKIGLCYDFVLKENIKYLKNKFNLDFLVTEKRII